MAKKEEDPKRCTTPEGRLSFPDLVKPRAHKDKPDDKKFNASLLLPKKVSLKELRASIDVAGREKWGDDYEKFKKSKKFHYPIMDGDEKEDLDGYAGMNVVKATTKIRPVVVDRDRNPIEVEELAEKVYAGCYVRLAVRAYGWENPEFKTRGVSLTLELVQFLRDGERFGGGPAAEDVFDDLEEEETEDADEVEEDDDTNSAFA